MHLSVSPCTNRTTLDSSRITSPTSPTFNSPRCEGAEPFLLRIYPIDYPYLVHNLPIPPASTISSCVPLLRVDLVPMGDAKESVIQSVPQPLPHAFCQ